MTTLTVTATDAPGPRPVATVTPLAIEGEVFLDVDIAEPLTSSAALDLAQHLITAARTLAA